MNSPGDGHAVLSTHVCACVWMGLHEAGGVSGDGLQMGVSPRTGRVGMGGHTCVDRLQMGVHTWG